MSIKERLEKLKLFFTVEEKLQSITLKLQEMESTISERKLELESLKAETVELKDFINQNFGDELNNYEYTVDLSCCHVIGFEGKKYIALVKHHEKVADMHNSIGSCIIETYKYHDALAFMGYNDDKKTRMKFNLLYEYSFARFSPRCGAIYDGAPPEYEVPILELYPELVAFTTGFVPDTYLKKIYYEINEIGSKQLLKKISERK